MPELPEVEFAGRHLKKWLTGRRIVKVEVDATRIVRPATPRSVQKALTGRTLQHLERRAKYLLLTFDEDVGVMSHLGMTGKWVRRTHGESERFSRLRLHLSQGDVVHYADVRLFGAFKVLAATKLHDIPAVAALGPDPLTDGLDGKTLGARLARTSRPVKVALMDQSLLAGIGNIQAAEALYRAKLNPKRPARSLDRAELNRLAKAIHATIAHTLASQGEADGTITYVEQGGENPFLVYDRLGERCRRCKTEFTRFTQSGRTTYSCPGCQPA
jgi:formamidopyrimidine-DNA glycosylase